jgi:hypothetical protein
MKAKTFAFILLAVLLALAATPVYAQSAPALPHAFYGEIDVNGSPASVGTKVEARGEGVQTGISNNPIVIIVEGEYGSSDPLEPRLIVQGDIAEGATLTFYVNGVSTGQTAEWYSGEVTELNLAATISGSPPEETTEPPPETTESLPETTESLPPPESTESTPELAPESTPGETPPAPLLPPPPPAKSGSWPVLWLVIGGVVVVGLIILVLARRRAY